MHMAFKEYGSYDAVGLADLVRRKQVSAHELLDEAIARHDVLGEARRRGDVIPAGWPARTGAAMEEQVAAGLRLTGCAASGLRSSALF
jgi:hypothetical protein